MHCGNPRFTRKKASHIVLGLKKMRVEHISLRAHINTFAYCWKLYRKRRPTCMGFVG